MTRRDPNASATFIGDFAAAFDLARAADLVRSRLNRRDVLARAVAHELNTARLAPHVEALATGCGVPVAPLRAAIALEVGRAREREGEARRAVRGGDEL